jgi:hypothetical protein
VITGPLGGYPEPSGATHLRNFDPAEVFGERFERLGFLHGKEGDVANNVEAASERENDGPEFLRPRISVKHGVTIEIERLGFDLEVRCVLPCLLCPRFGTDARRCRAAEHRFPAGEALAELTGDDVFESRCGGEP